jgi:hypothetical protein
MKARRRIQRVIVALAVAVMMGTAVGVAGASPAPAEAFHPSRMNKNWTPWTSTWSQGSQYWTVKAGTSVSMRCWNTGATRDGTAKWFWIRSNAYPFTQGYVPANSVSNQWLTSPHC